MGAISTRASMILGRVACTMPQTLDEATSKKLLGNANKILNKEGLIDTIKAEVRADGCNNQALQLPNIAMRVVVAILTKTDMLQSLRKFRTLTTWTTQKFLLNPQCLSGI